MKAAHVILRREINREDAQKIADWLEDSEITCFLNEHQNVSNNIKQVLERVHLPVLTHLFNQNGSFFMISTANYEPIGFLRLVPRHRETEMVIVIGDKKRWGQGFGTGAVLQGLRHAFFEWRMDKVVAKINMENHRSLRVFKRAGFQHEKELQREFQYSITLDDFLKLAA
jgi:RimJ/RimL family protein N-acetyltransferase